MRLLDVALVRFEKLEFGPVGAVEDGEGEAQFCLSEAVGIVSSFCEIFPSVIV